MPEACEDVSRGGWKLVRHWNRSTCVPQSKVREHWRQEHQPAFIHEMDDMVLLLCTSSFQGWFLHPGPLLSLIQPKIFSTTMQSIWQLPTRWRGIWFLNCPVPSAAKPLQFDWREWQCDFVLSADTSILLCTCFANAAQIATDYPTLTRTRYSSKPII